MGNKGHKLSIAIIYGAKVKDKSITEKCADCQQEKKKEELITIKDNNNKDIKYFTQISDNKKKFDLINLFKI